MKKLFFLPLLAFMGITACQQDAVEQSTEANLEDQHSVTVSFESPTKAIGENITTEPWMDIDDIYFIFTDENHMIKHLYMKDTDIPALDVHGDMVFYFEELEAPIEYVYVLANAGWEISGAEHLPNQAEFEAKFPLGTEINLEQIIQGITYASHSNYPKPLLLGCAEVKANDRHDHNCRVMKADVELKTNISRFQITIKDQDNEGVDEDDHYKLMAVYMANVHKQAPIRGMSWNQNDEAWFIPYNRYRDDYFVDEYYTEALKTHMWDKWAVDHTNHGIDANDLDENECIAYHFFVTDHLRGVDEIHLCCSHDHQRDGEFFNYRHQESDPVFILQIWNPETGNCFYKTIREYHHADNDTDPRSPNHGIHWKRGRIYNFTIDLTTDPTQDIVVEVESRTWHQENLNPEYVDPHPHAHQVSPDND